MDTACSWSTYYTGTSKTNYVIQPPFLTLFRILLRATKWHEIEKINYPFIDPFSDLLKAHLYCLMTNMNSPCYLKKNDLEKYRNGTGHCPWQLDHKSLQLSTLTYVFENKKPSSYLPHGLHKSYLLACSARLWLKSIKWEYKLDSETAFQELPWLWATTLTGIGCSCQRDSCNRYVHF